jgi:hypothetical protein
MMTKNIRLFFMVVIFFLQMGAVYAHDESMRSDAEQMREVSRGEFANMVAYSLKLVDIYENAYIDVDDHWARPYIGAVSAAELMSGDENGRFHPDQIMTLEQAVVILVRTMQVPPEPEAAAQKNLRASEWAKPYVNSALKLGLIPAADDFTKKLIQFDAISIIEKIDQIEAEKKARSRVQALD